MSDVSHGAWFKALKDSGGKVYQKAAEEVLMIGLISLLPLVAAAFYAYANQPHDAADHTPFFELMLSLFLNGQLLYYAASFIASVLWYSSNDLKRPFPLRKYFIAISVIGIFVTGVYISKDPSLDSLSNASVGSVSLIIYFVFGFMYFLMLCFFHATPPDYEEIQREGEDDLLNKMKNRREQGNVK